jgi:hypothetical protein
MMSILRIVSLLGMAVIATDAAQSLEDRQLASKELTQVASNEPAHVLRHHQSPAQEVARGDSAMQALCREILVDTDEGYGVTNREARVICDEPR